MQHRILPIPEAIADPRDGLELFRLWRSPNNIFVSWFIGDDWTVINFAKIIADAEIRIRSCSQNASPSAFARAVVNEVRHTVHDAQTDFSGGIGSAETPSIQDEVGPNALRLPLHNPEEEDAVEIIRGWADGSQLQISTRPEELTDPERNGWLITQLIQHAANALAQRDGSDFEDNIDRIWQEFEARTQL